MSKRNLAAAWFITGLMLSTLLIFPVECRNGAANGLFLCIQVLIPSLLPFMILSAFTVNSGILIHLPDITEKISKRVFGLPKAAFGVILISVIGGYPVGAGGISCLHREGYINEKEAQRMAMFCISAGPGFLVTYIGAAMTRQPKVGYVMLVSQILSVIILGFFSKLLIKDHTKNETCSKSTDPLRASDAIVVSVSEGINSALQMTALVAVFGAAAEIIITLTQNNPRLSVVVALLEITNGIKITADKYPFELISFLCGFGGLCVHFQIFQQLQGLSFSKPLFYGFRFAQALLCAFFTKILLCFFPIAEETLSTISSAKPQIKTSVLGCVFLFLTCAMFIISVRSLNLKSKHKTTQTIRR